MVKRIAKYGFKSGILPKPRQIVEPYKTRKEIEALEKANVGFRDPELIPKGVKAAVIPLKPRVTIDSIIEKSAKEPTPGGTASKRAPWRQELSAMRRSFLVQSLQNQDRAELRAMKLREKREARQEAEDLKKADPELTKQSESTLLTLPTIESFLNNTHPSTSSITSINDVSQFVVPRTRAEQKLLNTQRKANLVRKRLAETESRARSFLELYQSTSTFITTEEGLNAAIEAEFAQPDHPAMGGRFSGRSQGFFSSSLPFSNNPFSAFESSSTPSSAILSAPTFANVTSAGVSAPGTSVQQEKVLSESEKDSFRSTMAKQLYGVTSNFAPGLAEVEDAISGATVQHHKILAELLQEQERLQSQVDAERESK
ncbi:uncharacterized protein SAPINGB_P003236 [Magnusiomyces paraingens]|uniref:Uncharacterized protein n=1 Tax=Magnusiomyces paraingens TaxID=2606893 RepID=A0A5E8BMW5_9ASCO|nr:uncharacterized protein SAPINGB_P003236 [Saprochaete ingens]VVT51857.1 unnamed protein product [Saprochaete ingens]